MSMIARKYNSADEFEYVETPDGCTAYEETMSTMVTCPGCGKRIEFGSSFTSLEWFTPNGIWGLSVCRDCHDEEIMRRFGLSG